MREGFAIGGLLIAIGLVLEWSIGPVAWQAFRWPINGIATAAFVALVLSIHLLCRKFPALRFLSTFQAAIPAMACVVVLTIVMGLTRQSADGHGLHNMPSFWPFALVYAYTTLIVGLTVLKNGLKIRSRGKIVATLFHLGLFITMTTATLGHADVQRLKMITRLGETEWLAADRQGNVRKMPMAITLKHFIMETYDDGSPKRFASEIEILTRSGETLRSTIDVNKPAKVDGWKIYQHGYDTKMGSASRISILELVRDPWLPFVYVGIFLMLAGAVTMIVCSRWKHKRILTISTILLLAFICVNLFMPEIHSKTLMPALQSPWLLPHVIAYMFAYALMGAATVMAIYLLFFKKRAATDENYALTDSLVHVGLAFMTFGMLFGALWAKETWGHYWSWDPKETWAAITWIAYLIYIHYRKLPEQRNRLAFWMLIGSFVLLQMCWWGINYLPSAQGSSVHTYSTTE